MRVPISTAKSKLTELVRRVEKGEEVMLTRHGRPVVKMTTVEVEMTADELREKRERVLAEIRASVAAKKLPPGPDAARAADFLYNDDGLPA